MKIGILFGGRSREREVSFAGGRTVYDTLDKNLFEPYPLFIDSLGNLILLDWQFLYKGSIRDFYPPLKHQKKGQYDFQVYVEHLGLDPADKDFMEEMAREVGRPVNYDDLPSLIDFAFLALHGPFGEDGTIQGILQYHNIPYTSSGIFPSGFGMDKSLQKQWLPGLNFNAPSGFSITRQEWKNADHKALFGRLKENPGLPFVIKSATQGSSIGVSILKEDDSEVFVRKVNQSFFRQTIAKEEWSNLSRQERLRKIQHLNDLDSGIGLPVTINDREVVSHPEALYNFVEEHFENSSETLVLESTQTETRVVFESMIQGREFSCIVIQQEDGQPVALPPTEIIKKTDLFDYRAKYLPGISRKITPIDLPEKDTQNIRKECERLFNAMRANVYARIDGFIDGSGTIYLNDPNTTSGMMPSSFFFHQAAEIGLNPTQYLTYIIHQSLTERIKDFHLVEKSKELLARLNQNLEASDLSRESGKKVAVVLGGWSSERHISVESGRNVVEKLSAARDYDPFPVFLMDDGGEPAYYKIPVNLLLKDNADDIADKIRHFAIHPISEKVIGDTKPITDKFGDQDYDFYPEKLSLTDMAGRADFCFIGLHGRPGEDGTLQLSLEKEGVPYNGSPPPISELTIDKFSTNRFLSANGFSTPENTLVRKDDWQDNGEQIIEKIRQKVGFPCIAKPADDGCSSAVIKVDTSEELKAYARASFRDQEEDLVDEERAILSVGPTEPFPARTYFMVEELVDNSDCDHFLEITGGLLTHYQSDGSFSYEILEPSEALAEGGILSLEEKFLAGEGQNITPARFVEDPEQNRQISQKVKEQLKAIAETLNLEGYARIDAFVKIREGTPEVIFIEVNSLPGLTPATVIFHQAALNGYKPIDFLEAIIQYGIKKQKLVSNKISDQ